MCECSMLEMSLITLSIRPSCWEEYGLDVSLLFSVEDIKGRRFTFCRICIYK